MNETSFYKGSPIATRRLVDYSWDFPTWWPECLECSLILSNMKYTISILNTVSYIDIRDACVVVKGRTVAALSWVRVLGLANQFYQYYLYLILSILYYTLY